MPLRFAPLLVFAFCCAACDPGYLIEAEILADDGGPIAGAQMTIACAHLDSDQLIVGTMFTSNADGGIGSGTVGCGPDVSCSVTVEATGFATWTSTVSNLCTSLSSELSCGSQDCADLEFTATLSPSP